MMRVLQLLLCVIAVIALGVLAPSARVDAATESITVTSDHTNVTLKWPRVADAKWYNLYWQRTDTANAGENKIVNATSPYTHESLVPGATYRYRIVAANKNLERDTGLIATATLPPAAPTLLDLQGSAHSATLQWDKVPGANHYRIFWNTRGGVSNSDAAVTASQSPYTHKGLQSGARYYYRIAAQNAGGDSELSRETSVQLPSDAPIIDSVTGGEGEATLMWPAVEAAESYNLYWNTYGGVTRDNTKKANVSAAYIHTGLLRGATYFYRLSAVSAVGESELSPEVAVTLAPAPPVVQLHPDSGHASDPTHPTRPTPMARLEWPAVFGATSYQAYWDTRPGMSSSANKISSVSSPFTPSEMRPGELRYYRVAAVNGGGESLSKEVAVALRPATPSIARSENTARQITLHAEPVLGATTYTLYWNTHADITSTDNKIPNITLPYTHAGLTHGGSYYYRLAAQNVGGESALSLEVQVTLPPDMPVITSISGGDGQVQLKWNPVASSTSYVVYWNTTGNVSRTDTKVSSSKTQWLHAVLNNGAKYFYRVAAVNAGGESELAPQVSVVLAPDAPRIEAAMSGERQITVRWNNVAGATSYNLYWNSGTKVSVRDTKISATASPFVQDSLPKGATYSYLVSALNEGGETLTAPLQATLIPEIPEPPLAQGGNKQTQLSWKPVSGATSYRVLWHSPGKFTAAEGYLDAVEPNVVHTGQLNGSVYFYRVVAVNAGGKSAPSAEIKLTLAPDAPLIRESRGGDKQVTLAWNSVPGATSYTLYWQNSGDASAAENKIVNVVAPYQHLHLSNGLSYHYRVAAVNVGGETASAPVRVTLIPDVPVIGKITGGDKQATLTWNAVRGVTAYTVYWNSTGNVSERDPAFDTAQTTHLQTALENGKTYFYRMSARNEEGASALSKEAAVTLAPDAPTLESALGGDRAVTLKWAPSAGATGYRVYWNTSGAVSATDMTTPLLALTNLTRGATYYFRIAALNAGGENLAPEISVTLAPGATTISSIKGGDKQSTLAWKTADGATEYHIYWNNKGNVTTRDPVLTTGASTFVHPGIKNGMKYFYRIAAANSGGESELSAESTVMLAPDAPQINFTSGEDKRITIGWSAVPGADTYNIYWKPLENNNAKPTKVTNATAPHVFTGLHNGTKYTYSITSVNSGGEGSKSEQVVVVPHNKKLLGLFPDPGLQRCITSEAAANGWTYGDDISGVLVCNDADIHDLSGMEWLENLTNLSLRNNQIVNLSKLSGLSRLTYLALDTNTIEDLRPLASLNKLNYLSLNENALSDLSPLAELQTLTSLYLNNTKVSDLTPLSQLVNLVYLLVSNSEIVDVRPLSNLRNLARLYLSGNRIVDVKALASLTSLLELDISGNAIGNKAPGHVNALVLLKNARLLMVGDNPALSCHEVTTLINRLGSPPVDLDGIITNFDLAVEEENCVKP